MLPYTAEVLFALHARYLGELWPAAVALCALTLAVLCIAWRGRPGGGRLAGGLLALGWLWVGAVFHLHYFAAVNFAAPLYAGLFILQGLLLVWYGPVRGRLAMRRGTDGPGWIGTIVVLLAILGYPLLDVVSGYPIEWPRLVGLAAGPTALYTLGLLLHTTGRTPLPLLAVPTTWSLVAGFSGWVLGLPADLGLAPLAAIALGAAWWKNRRHERNGRPDG